MKPQLSDIIDKLANDQFFAVRITDLNKGLQLYANKTGAEMIAEKGSIVEFFNALYDRGVTKVVIQPRRKNGSSWKDGGEANQYTFGTSDDSNNTGEPIAPTQAPAFTQDFSVPGLMAGNVGLNALAANYRVMDYERVMRENAELKEKNKKLSKKVKRHERDALENQFSESKAQGNKDLLQQLVSTAPALLGAFAAAKGGGAVIADSGLASPVADLSPAKQHLIEAINQCGDYVSDLLLTILLGMNNNNDFGTELQELMTRHNLQSA